MCDLKANLNLIMSRLCKLITLSILIIKKSILSDQIMNILQQNIDEGSV